MNAIPDAPDGDERAKHLSAAFEAAGWTPSTENFGPRPFVKWQNGWYSAAGFPPNGSCVSKSCKTADDVLSMLNAASVPAGAAPVDAKPDYFAGASLVFRKQTPSGPGWDEPRIKAIEARLDVLEAQSRQLAERDAEPPPLSPDPVKHMIPEEIRKLMQGDETLPQARQRLWPILNAELGELKNQEALFNKTIPRRAEVEQIISILARLGEG